MLITIISDIHDNIVNLEKCLAWCGENKIAKIICCGDVCNKNSLKFFAVNFKKDIFLVKGNAELYEEKELKKFKNIQYFGKTGVIEIDNKKIGFCHEPFLINKVVELGALDFVFYGHTHKPWLERKKGIQIANPGTLGAVFQKATFAVWDTESGRLELKLLEALE